jgi:tripartite-type tricarboxylate transporter receptor subunit TctC
MWRRRMILCALACAAMLAAADAHAQSDPTGYPSKPIRMIVPFPPGGPIDVMGRLVGDRLSQGLGQTVVIENRPGAGAVIGSKAAASAEADGYTLLFGSSGSLAVTPALYRNAGYDPVRSFAPVAAVAEGTMLLATHPSLPAKSVAELVAHARANPGKLNYGSGLGTPPHIAWGLFKLLTKTEVQLVPYKGAAPAITDLVAGRHAFIIDSPGVLLPHVEEGRLRALAVTSPARYADLPDVPTMVEAGYPDFVMTFWTGVVAPKGTPAAVVGQLNRVINDALRTDEMKAALARFRVEPRPGSAQDFAAFIASESKKWADVITAAGIKVE